MANAPRTLRNANLNLIPVLRALLKDSSVSRASESLGLSQSATSGALARLRVLLGDPILVQVGRSMRLTPRGRELVLPLEHLCGAMEELLRSDQFDPAHTEREFVVAAPDFVSVLIGNPMMEVLRTVAPTVSVYFTDISADLADRLNAGEVDLAILDLNFSSWKGLSSSPGFNDRSVGVVRTGHPLAGKAAPSQADLAAYPQIRWKNNLLPLRPPATPQASQTPIFARQFVALPLLVLESDCLAIVPRLFAQWMARLIPLSILPLAHSAPEIQMGLLWSPVHEPDPAHRWFRKMIESVLPAGEPAASSGQPAAEG